jgi:hypothetical protein
MKLNQSLTMNAHFNHGDEPLHTLLERNTTSGREYYTLHFGNGPSRCHMPIVLFLREDQLAVVHEPLDAELKRLRNEEDAKLGAEHLEFLKASRVFAEAPTLESLMAVTNAATRYYAHIRDLRSMGVPAPAPAPAPEPEKVCGYDMGDCTCLHPWGHNDGIHVTTGPHSPHKVCLTCYRLGRECGGYTACKEVEVRDGETNEDALRRYLMGPLGHGRYCYLVKNLESSVCDCGKDEEPKPALDVEGVHGKDCPVTMSSGHSGARCTCNEKRQVPPAQDWIGRSPQPHPGT